MDAETLELEGALRSLLERHPDPALRLWIIETTRSVRARLSSIADPEERRQVRDAALMMIRETLIQWAGRPALPH